MRKNSSFLFKSSDFSVNSDKKEQNIMIITLLAFGSGIIVGSVVTFIVARISPKTTAVAQADIDKIAAAVKTAVIKAKAKL